jgi:hypothetical protein
VKQKRAVILKTVDQHNVFVFKRVTGMHPLEILGKPAVKGDLSQQPEFFLPLFELVKIRIQFGIPFAFAHQGSPFVKGCLTDDRLHTECSR